VGRTNVAKVNHCLASLQTAKGKTHTFLFHYLSLIAKHMMWNIIFISFGQLSWLCPLPVSLLWDLETVVCGMHIYMIIYISIYFTFAIRLYRQEIKMNLYTCARCLNIVALHQICTFSFSYLV